MSSYVVTTTLASGLIPAAQRKNAVEAVSLNASAWNAYGITQDADVTTIVDGKIERAVTFTFTPQGVENFPTDQMRRTTLHSIVAQAIAMQSWTQLRAIDIAPV